MRTINGEIKRNVNSPNNTDNLKSKYKETNGTITVTFPSFLIRVLSNNLFTLLSKAKKVPFKNEWTYRPDYTSCDAYKTEIYWQLILYVNSISCIENYINLDTIYLPSINSISQLLKYRIKNEVAEIDITNINNTLYKTSPLLYTSNPERKKIYEK